MTGREKRHIMRWIYDMPKIALSPTSSDFVNWPMKNLTGLLLGLPSFAVMNCYVRE